MFAIADIPHFIHEESKLVHTHPAASTHASASDRYAWHNIRMRISAIMFSVLQFSNRYSIRHLSYLSFKTNCSTPHRCAALLSLTSICVHRTRHALGHIRAFDSELIVYKLLVQGSRAYRQRQRRLRISHRLFFLFNLFALHISSPLYR